KNAIAHAILGEIYCITEKYDRAILHCQKAIEVNPNDLESNYHLGLAYAKKTLHFSAIAYLEKVVKLQHNNLEAWKLLGDCYEARGRLDEARNCWRKVAELDPHSPTGIEARKKLTK
ncbi:MAG: tetratricopeptide repeat protein, partial [Elusimicrobiota bacterium]|nr:tetratricopeptide repeat protein [Elusimicrobiota bacterium]